MKILSKDYKYRRQVGWGLLAIYVLVPIMLILLPADYFDTGQAMCLSVLFFHKECFGCGITRAIQHLIHLDFDAALSYNKLSFFVLPIFAASWLIYFIMELFYLLNIKRPNSK